MNKVDNDRILGKHEDVLISQQDKEKIKIKVSVDDLDVNKYKKDVKKQGISKRKSSADLNDWINFPTV